MDSPVEQLTLKLGPGSEAGSNRGLRRSSGNKSERLADETDAPRKAPTESWVDAVVTLLATVVFGLGWALVELERADPIQDRYDSALSVAWSATEQMGGPGEQWSEVARQRSRR